MPTVADCLRQHAPAYLVKFGERMPLAHHKVLSSLTRCRTGQLGSVHYQCDGCGRDHWVGRSCGNRHCATCGQQKTYRWLAKQTSRLLPVPHFMVTFTVPEELRGVLRAHQRDGYRCLFEAAAQSVRDVGSATKSLAGCQLGFFGVLHTWGRDPTVYHPHVHFVVPAGGVKLDAQGQAIGWQQTPENFFVHHGTLVEVYKAKLAAALRECQLHQLTAAAAWQKRFVVDIRPVGDGRAVLKYLAPYVHRVAISDRRIVACDENSVTFRYTPSKSSAVTVRRVAGEEFVRGFLQHTLPRGLQKIRYYGWMSANSKVDLEEVRWLVWLALGWTYWLASGKREEPVQPAPLRCAACGDVMRVVEVTTRTNSVLTDHALAYLDSG